MPTIVVLILMLDPFGEASNFAISFETMQQCLEMQPNVERLISAKMHGMAASLAVSNCLEIHPPRETM